MKVIYEKKRYISFKVIGDVDIEKFLSYFKNFLIKYLGLINYSQNRVFIIKYNKQDNSFIIKCNKDYVDQILCATNFIDNFDGKPINVLHLNVSGTLKKLGGKDVRTKKYVW